MAVIASFREANELDVLTKARQLAEYIFTICKNEKQFPRRDHYRCWKANAQRGNTRNLLKQMDRTYTDIMKEEPP